MSEYERTISLPAVGGLLIAWGLMATSLLVLRDRLTTGAVNQPLEAWAIDVAVLFGMVVVLPLALGGRAWWWLGVGLSASVAFGLPTGFWAAAFALPWLALCLAITLARLRAAPPLMFVGPPDVVAVVAPAFAGVAAGAVVQSRLGLALLGVGEPFMELTGVHFVFAGTASLVLAGAAWTASQARWRSVARVAIGLVVLAPPIVAAGFVTRSALAQVGGAVLMTAGVWLVAALHLRAAADWDRPVAGRLLLGLSGLAVWAPMALAVAWVVAQYWTSPALSIPAMLGTHGGANSIGFVICGLLGRRLSEDRLRAIAPSPSEVGP
jgi:YndJ-like protein